jgi:hypothetical protein
MPSTDEIPLPGELDALAGDILGGFTTAGGGFDTPPEAPATHTPLKWVGMVPYGQLLTAAAGEATANGPNTIATAHPPIRILRFTATNSHVSVKSISLVMAL